MSNNKIPLKNLVGMVEDNAPTTNNKESYLKVRTIYKLSDKTFRLNRLPAYVAPVSESNTFGSAIFNVAIFE